MSALGNLFGGGGTPINYTPRGFSNPQGFSISGGGKVTQSPQLAGAIGSLSSTFGNQATALGALGTTVAPGFSYFRQAGLADITSEFQANRSNLEQNLAQRRILGSSFANSSFSQTAADEAKTKADFEATSYLQELEAYNKILQEQFTASTNQYGVYVNQGNLQSQAALQLTQTNNQIAAQIATANANLQAQSAAGAGRFFGTLVGAGLGFAVGGPAGAAIGAGIGGGAFGGAAGGGGGGVGTGAPASFYQPFGGAFSGGGATPGQVFSTGTTAVPYAGY